MPKARESKLVPQRHLHVSRPVSLRRNEAEIRIDSVTDHARIHQRQVRHIELHAVEQVKHLRAELQLMSAIDARDRGRIASYF